MQRENWLTVPGWTGYEVSSRGRVRSVERALGDGRIAGGLVLAQTADKDGYRYVTLSDGKRRKRVHVAVLVLTAFTGPCPPGQEACHKNGRRGDNRAVNLRWGTRPENRQDRERHERQRAARRAARAAVAGAVKNGKRPETDDSASCPLLVDSGVSPC